MELNLLKKFEVFNTEGGVPCPTAWEQFTFEEVAKSLKWSSLGGTRNAEKGSCKCFFKGTTLSAHCSTLAGVVFVSRRACAIKLFVHLQPQLLRCLFVFVTMFFCRNVFQSHVFTNGWWSLKRHPPLFYFFPVSVSQKN